MLLSAALVATAFVLIVVTPTVLKAGPWAVRHPRTALLMWFSACALGCACVVASIVAAVIGGLMAGDAPDGATAIALTVGSWLGLGIVGAAIALIVTTTEPIVHASRVSLSDVVPAHGSVDERRALTLARITSNDVVACSLPGRDPAIIIPSRLEAALTRPQLQAVIAHEYAHLRGRHHLLKAVASINTACLPPRLRAGRELKRATTLLLELIADDAAAKQAGPVHLANALAAIGDLTGDAGLHLRAERLAIRRWPRSRSRRVPVAIKI
ncbi:M56 family metallopeptidase [Paramicrobacterium chengjingii]|uniref:M56 family metallopeptidase n=1 Tax=Paramicrobacterium chengjingii TaxID=2769067 RepID=A0ABX6YH03_9MICO|nr:M56 family metallopeptidase [Microbacterium chengjingii]QPZ37970.1 M56 family metallopeptidase [Microbacterium chengjingii]